MTHKYPKRKPYQPPTIRTDDVTETSTLACGKCSTGGPTGASTQVCKQAKKLS